MTERHDRDDDRQEPGAARRDAGRRPQPHAEVRERATETQAGWRIPTAPPPV